MMLSRRDVLRSLLILLTIPESAVASAQRPDPTPARVGWLSYVGEPDPGLERLRVGLQELGHVEGRSYVVVAKFADGDFTRLPGLVEELGAEGIDVLVTRGPSTDYAKPIRSKVPVVFAYSGDPVESGFAKSLARPGLNMTGITFMALGSPPSASRSSRSSFRAPRRSRYCPTPNIPESSPSTGSPTRPHAASASP
jgi:ABC-type uncharacterized transport system substrate-binding protein